MDNKIKCPHCNEEVEGDSEFCSKCGKPIKENVVAWNNEQAVKSNKRPLGALIIAIGTISFILLFNAGSQIKKGSLPMATLTSEAGNTVAEAYYQDMGQVLKGFSYLCYGLGLAVLGISVDLGTRKMK